MKFGLFIFSIFLFSSAYLFPQNVLVDSLKIAVFASGSYGKSDGLSNWGISGGVILGNKFGIMFQRGNGHASEANHYPTRNEEIHTSVVTLKSVLQRKKFLLTLDLSVGTSTLKDEIAFLFGVGFSISRKYQITEGVEGGFNFSPMILFNVEHFPLENAYGAGLDGFILLGKHFFFGPSVGYGNGKLFYGVGVGLVIPFVQL